MTMRRFVPTGTYLTAGVVLGYVTFASIMAGVWGARVGPAQYLAMLGILVLIAAALNGVLRAEWGRRVAAVGLAMMAPMWLNGPALLLPHGMGLTIVLGWILVGLYVASVGVTLFYPTRWRWSGWLLTLLVLSAVIPTAIAAISARRAGEYSRPVLEFIKWIPGGQTLERDRNGFKVIDDDVLALLRGAGITGRVSGAGGDRSDANGEVHRLIVMLAAQVPSRQRLHYPRGPLIIYAFDGSRWRTFPEGAATYPLFLTVEPHDRQTMVWLERSAGGRSGHGAFFW
jgi:hypothetical protein